MRAVFLLDVDNTLLDNDAAKRAIADGLERVLAPDPAKRFWVIYEDVRRASGVVDYPETLARFHRELGEAANADRVVMELPYERFVYEAAPAVVARLWTLGIPVILSDGDPLYQPRKIVRAGLAAAVRGNVLVYAHKEDRLDEVVRTFPAEHYTQVDDRPSLLAETKARLDGRVTTVHVRQGHYSGEPPGGAAPDVSLAAIGDLLELAPEQLTGVG